MPHVSTLIAIQEKEIWKILEILRSESIASEDYPIALFLLSLYKDGIILRDMPIGYGGTRNHILASINDSSDLPTRQYLPIYPIFEPVLNRLSSTGFMSIIHILFELDRKFLSENYSVIFDSILYRITQSQGRYGGEFLQPLELTRFICALADLPKEAKVFNPFAGLASFGAFLDHGQEYYGQEVNIKTWALGTLRLMAHEQLNSSRYVCDDSILNWPNSSEKYELIVSNPPYGFRFDNNYREYVHRNRTVEHFLVDRGIHSLTNDGKLIALLPQGILFKGMQHEQELRQFLVDKDLLDMIISLPGGLLSNVGIPLVILVINKKKGSPGKVRFIKADKFVEARNPRGKVLNDYALNDLIQGAIETEDCLRIVDNAQIQEWDYNLNVPRYFQNEIALESNEKLVKLKDILIHVRGQRGNLPENGKLVRIRDLRDDKVDFRLKVSEIEDFDLRRPHIHQINETCLLLAIRWRTLKPTYFEFDDTPIYRSQDILSFKVNEYVADYAYVINELHADYVQEQLDAYLMGSTIPFIRREDLLEVAIKVPSFDRQQSLEIQRAKIAGLKEISYKIKQIESERNSIAHGVSSRLYESVSTIKHSLGKPLLNIGSSLRNIENALSKFSTDWELIKLNERYDLTIKDTFKSVYSNLELIHSMLRKNEFVLDVGNYELTEIDLLAFIRGYVNTIKSAERSNVNTIIDVHPDIKIQLKNKIMVQGNVELLEIGLNAIVENANMHAFTDEFKKYKLEFRVSLYVTPGVKQLTDDTIGKFDTYIKVEVANNGKPFPKNFTLEKLVRMNSFAGETGHTGQGGFVLNEIIKRHNNGMSTLELIADDYTTEFTTTYSFLIPLN